jgi:competence protein ComEC
MLTTGDVDWVGLQNLLEEGGDIRADILVFPHHGGKAGGSDPKQFAAEICSRVQPRSVIFSIARTRTGFPRVDTIDGVVEVAPEAHIACTQLSQECAKDTPTEFQHLLDYPAKGRDRDSCCAGTIRIDLNREEDYLAFNEAHGAFVKSLAPTMCRTQEAKNEQDY